MVKIRETFHGTGNNLLGKSHNREKSIGGNRQTGSVFFGE